MDGDKRATLLGTRYVERFLRRLFNTQGPVVTDHLRGDVQVSVEARPAFPWDWPDFGIVGWHAYASQAAVAAQFTGIELGPGNTGYHLVVLGAKADGDDADLMTNGTADGLATNVPLYVNDAEWGQFTLIPQFGVPTICQVGTDAAPSGVVLRRLRNGIETEFAVPIILRVGVNAFCKIYLRTVNVAATFSLWGLGIPASVANL